MFQLHFLIPITNKMEARDRFLLSVRQSKIAPFFRFFYLLSIYTFSILLVAVGQATAANVTYLPTQQPYVINNQEYHPIPSSSGYKETGIASWYGPDFNGHTTSNGEVYNMYGMTAAHKLLPMNTILLVSNLENGRSTIVRINDRGPFVQGRILDLSYTAAKKLDLVQSGTAKVRVTAIGKAGNPKSEPEAHNQEININFGEFYIQVGAFQQKTNALRLQKKFADFGHSTIIQQFFSQKSILYRVCVYAGRELQGAYKAERSLHQHGWLGAFVVAK